MIARNLDVDSATSYLIQKALIGTEAVVGGDLEIVDLGRRNQNLKITLRRGIGYLIKQPGEGEWGTQSTIRREAWFYSHCWSDASAIALRDYLPALRGWDDERGLMTLELIDGRSLWDYYGAPSSEGFPSAAAAPLGAALGILHRTFRVGENHAEWPAKLPSVPPWIFSVHRPTPELFARMSPATLGLIRMIQEDPTLPSSLGALGADWLENTFIHNDMKGDNVIVSDGGEAGVRVRIIDWELLQIGDAAWDVGAVFRDFLGYWLLSVPLSGDLTAERMIEGAGVPLNTIHPATRAFWHAYIASSEIGPAAGELLIRSMRFAAARLVQGAYEVSSSMPEPPRFAVALLQLAANILSDPREAALHLFGLALPWKGPVRAARVS